MSDVLYRKKGRRYVPVSEYDPLVMDAMPAGAHLIVVEPGIKSTRYNIEPEFAGVLAAVRVFEWAIQDAMREAAIPKPSGPWTTAQLKAWDSVKHILGRSRLESEGLHGIVAAGCRALEAKIMEGNTNG